MMTLTKGANAGLRFFRSALFVHITNDGNGRYIKQHYQLDMRESPDDADLSVDRKTRDFTVNSIYLWPNEDYSKYEFDFPENGETDIEHKIVRPTNSFEETFSPDPGRFLRALRLKIQYGFNLDPELD